MLTFLVRRSIGSVLVCLAVTFIVFLIEAVLILSRSGFADRAFPAAAPPPDILAGNTEVIGRALYTTYLFPFEVASLILLVAMIGAIILAKKGMFDRQTVGAGLKPAPTDRKTD